MNCSDTNEPSNTDVVSRFDLGETNTEDAGSRVSGSSKNYAARCADPSEKNETDDAAGCLSDITKTDVTSLVEPAEISKTDAASSAGPGDASQTDVTNRFSENCKTNGASLADPRISQLSRGVESDSGGSIKTESLAIAEKIVAQFNRLDADGNGTIERQEMVDMLHALDAELWTRVRVEQLFQAMDKNEDNAIQFEEFVAWAFNKDNLYAHDLRVSCDLTELAPAASSAIFRLEKPLKVIPAPKAAGRDHAGLTCIAVGPRPLIALGNESGAVFILDFERGQCLRTLFLEAGQRSVAPGGPVASLHFSSDGSMLACAADMLFIFDVGKGECLATLSNDRREHVKDCAWAVGDGKIVVAEGTASKIWDLDTSRRGSVRGTIGNIHRCDRIHRVNGCCFTSDGGVVSVGSHPGVFLFSGSSRRRRSSSRGSHSSHSVAPTLLGEHDGHVYRCYLSPCGKSLLTISSDKFPAVWNLENMSCRFRLIGHTGIPKAGSFYREGDSPGNLLVATAADDHTVRIWDAQDGQCLAVVDVGAPVVGVAFCGDTKGLPTLFSVTEAGVQLWELTAVPNGDARQWRAGLKLKNRDMQPMSELSIHHVILAGGIAVSHSK